jgi:hypothetical protein
MLARLVSAARTAFARGSAETQESATTWAQHSSGQWSRWSRDATSSNDEMLGMDEEQRLLSFGGGEEALRRWRVFTDREHGGKSECAMKPASDESAVFRGSTSLELEDAIFSAEVNRTATKCAAPRRHAQGCACHCICHAPWHAGLAGALCAPTCQPKGGTCTTSTGCGCGCGRTTRGSTS